MGCLLYLHLDDSLSIFKILIVSTMGDRFILSGTVTSTTTVTSREGSHAPEPMRSFLESLLASSLA